MDRHSAPYEPERRALARAVPLAVFVLGMLGSVALVGFIMRPAHAPTMEHVAARQGGIAPNYSVASTSITPITAITDPAAGFPYSGESYNVACTIAGGSVTLYPAVHDGVRWQVFQNLPCGMDSATAAEGTCPMAAPIQASGLTWNVLKTGAGTLSACTASARSGPAPVSKAAPSSGPGSGTVTSIDCDTGLTCTPDPITSTGTIALTIPVVATSGGTGQTTVTTGDLLYGSAANTWSKLADVAAGSYLRSGGVGVAPLWSTLTLPNAATTGDILAATSANTVGVITAGAVGTVLTGNGAGVAPTFQAAASTAGGLGIYGDGSDGDVSISGGTTTLARDMFYNTLTVTSTGVLKTARYRVYAKTAIVVESGGSINDDGNDASGSTQGNALTATILGGAQAGRVGGTGAGTAGANISNTFGGAGGAGGAGSGGAGGAGGTATVPGASFGHIRTVPQTVLGALIYASGQTQYTAGVGGGSGGGNGASNGGGGGGGGGNMVLVAKSITNSGTISAIGGDGGTGTANNCGGGGGGGGGVILITTSSYTGTAPSVAGGTRGLSGGGTGVNGTDGSTGFTNTLIN